LRERGYSGAATNRIAEQVGIAIGSLYQYFPNKNSILAVLLEQHAREVTNAVEAIRSMSQRSRTTWSAYSSASCKTWFACTRSIRLYCAPARHS
jgi:AcrR family transcriptional regulator